MATIMWSRPGSMYSNGTGSETGESDCDLDVRNMSKISDLTVISRHLGLLRFIVVLGECFVPYLR